MSIQLGIIIYLLIGVLLLMFFGSYDPISDKHSYRRFREKMKSEGWIEKVARILFIGLWILVVLYYLAGVVYYIVVNTTKK